MVNLENNNSYVKAVICITASRQDKYITASIFLVQIFKKKAFDKLRIKHGLGYVTSIDLEFNS